MEITNKQRGCGFLRPGMCYLQGDGSDVGSLSPLVWVLGSHVIDGGSNVFPVVPPRGVSLFDPELTLDREELYEYIVGRQLRDARSMGDHRYAGSGKPQLERLSERHPMAIIDHVGESNYTPLSFAEELLRLGPSRAVQASVARMIAPYLPMRIFFTMRVPFFRTERHRDEFWDAHMSSDRFEAGDANLLARLESLGRHWSFDATWSQPEWGWSVHDDNGSSHYMIPVLALHQRSGNRGMYLHESFFCGSWITSARYVLCDDEDSLPDELVGSMVEPVRAGPRQE